MLLFTTSKYHIVFSSFFFFFFKGSKDNGEIAVDILKGMSTKDVENIVVKEIKKIDELFSFPKSSETRSKRKSN